jgi:Fe-S oxidoreductase
MGNPHPVETVLFLVLLSTSAFLFWKRFSVVISRIRAARPDVHWTDPLHARDFLTEVLFQTKVIKERPLPGLAHAFVFWGFISFALITINHFLEVLGWGLPMSHTTTGQAYRLFVGAFAVAVAISIAGLAFRRFLVRPKWLEPLSPESGLIAFLIFTLMVTYLATFQLEEGSAAGKMNWWAHTIALLVFLPLIPHTKHLHLVLSPYTILKKRDGFSRIPPLAGDEDFGLDTGKDITNLITLQAYSCVECGRCTEHCPAYTTGKELNPKQIILGVRGYLNEHGFNAEPALVGTHISEQAVFQCTTCGACEYQCPVGIQHLPVIIGLRRGLVNTGKWEDEHGNKLFLNLEKNGNPMGFASADRQKFIEKNQIPWFDGTQEYCLWLGCMGAYDPKGREIVLALVQVLNHLKVTYGVLRKERCTGDSARRLGNDLLFSQLAEGNIETMKSAKVTKLLSICPHCVRTIGEDWKEFGSEFTIEHHSGFLSRYASQLPRDGDERIVFHDPCYLGRYRDSYDDARSVAALAGSVVDPPRSRERSRCCGAGGGLVFLGEEKGKRVNVDRAEELVASGAKVIAAACPFCQTMFRDALGQISSEPPKLLDIAQLAAARLPSARDVN